MRLHRFVDSFDFSHGALSITNLETVNQIKNVFRLETGDKLILVDGKSSEAIAEITEITAKSVDVDIVSVHENRSEPKNYSVLYCAVLKKENFELVVQKAVEVGVREIIPVITERTIKLNLNIDRLEKIIKEAVEQSGRAVVPFVSLPVSLKEAMGGVVSDSLNIFLDGSGENDLPGVIENNKTERICAWVGPEGGWSEKEIELAKAKGFEIMSLGVTTLRAETAAIVASYLISNL